MAPDPDDVSRVIGWATSDSFWRTNIRSPAKLREHWPRLAMQSRDGWVEKKQDKYTRLMQEAQG